MPIRFQHRFENMKDKLVGDIGMEEIGHRVDEDHPRLRPLLRMVESFRPQSHGKRVVAVLGRVDDWKTSNVDVVQPLPG